MPARPENVRLARLTAAAVGSRIGFGIDTLDDLRMAVDELCYCLMGDGGAAGELVLVFDAVPDGLGVEGHLAGRNGLPRELPELSRRIFDALTTTYDCRLDGRDRWFKMTKRVGP
jgi:hypothetical protein